MKKIVAGALAAAMLLFGAPLLAAAFVVSATSASAQQNPCDSGGLAVTVDPATVPAGPIAGYNHQQLTNAAYVMLAGGRLHGTVRDQQIGVMTAMGESGLIPLDHGDAAGPDSRGMFGQRDIPSAWGSYADRMDPFISATNFFKVEMTIPNRDTLAPTLVAHATQHNADPDHYIQWWEPAVTVVSALAGVQATTPGNGSPTPTGTPPPIAGSSYDLGAVRPQTAAVAHLLGPMFGITTIYGYRGGADAQDHAFGLALDFMVYTDSAKGQALADYVQQHAAELDVQYLIWRRHIWNVDRAVKGWRLMEDRGSPTQNHIDHVHVSLTGTGAVPTAGGEPCNIQAPTGGPAAGTWTLPLAAGSYTVTAEFGSISSVRSGPHTGTDLASTCGAAEMAAGAGIISHAGPGIGWAGNYVVIDHGGGITTWYAHMSSTTVAVGQRVQPGQQVGVEGWTGNVDPKDSRGCHLHFEVRVNDIPEPTRPFLSARGVTL